ncbi:hypothetical protein DSO57_1008686 [Entomophthora muscae]|uniref:Uncharacterized protein n=1 Tax=Entomophthora muscae TaxID=34485 RepID=A0ACC2U567_9FUNG|nr:hypothetical protein DSO57_1008686 [Entomophthora muscae]
MAFLGLFQNSQAFGRNWSRGLRGRQADSEPTKEHCTKKGKNTKDPTFSSGKKKMASKQASKNSFHPPSDGSFPLHHLTPKMSLRSTPRSLKLLVTWLGIHWPSVMNDISILVLKTQELNPSSLKAD